MSRTWLCGNRRAHSSSRGRHQASGPQPVRFHPVIEVLEGRDLPSTFVVSINADSGTGSLRAAILSANDQPGLSTIDFSIGSGLQAIELASPLPVITEPVVLDGSTQPGFTGSPLIVLDGSAAVPASDGLTFTAGGSSVLDLAIDGFGGSGIVLSGSGSNVISGDYIGIAPGSSSAAGNGQRGIYANGSSNNTIGGATSGAGNDISGNGWSGILIDDGGSSNLIEGNLIGTDVNGSLPLGNGGDGIRIADGTNNQIGGTTSQVRNVISANVLSGVFLDDGSTGNQLQGNDIGTDATGTSPLGNQQRGVLASAASNNTIGGTVTGAGNVISANLWSGVLLTAGASDNVVQGNSIGTDSGGTISLGNGGDGVAVRAADNNLIGGSATGAANTIANNLESGALVDGAQAGGNAILGNVISANDLGGILLSNGGNGMAAAPALGSLSIVSNAVLIPVALTGAVSTTYTLDCYVNSATDASGQVEGQVFLGSKQVTTDVIGNASVDVEFTASLSSGHWITATATDPSDNTSAFSQPAAFAGATVITLTSSPNASMFGQAVTFTASVSVLAPGGGTPTGTVDFQEGATDLTPGGVTLLGGVATFSTAALTLGSHTVTAAYGGDGTFLASSADDSAAPQVVNAASSSTLVTSSPNASV